MLKKIEWIIALLYANNNEPIKGITRLEKLLFFYLNKYMKNNYINNFNFEPYRFGPHSDEIRDILYALRDKGLIEIKLRSTDNLLELDIGVENDEELKPINYDKQEIFKLTPFGMKIAKKIINKNLSLPEFNQLSKFKEKFNKIKLNKLIRIIYTEFPEMTIKSEILDDIYKNQA